MTDKAESVIDAMEALRTRIRACSNPREAALFNMGFAIALALEAGCTEVEIAALNVIQQLVMDAASSLGSKDTGGGT